MIMDIDKWIDLYLIHKDIKKEKTPNQINFPNVFNEEDYEYDYEGEEE